MVSGIVSNKRNNPKQTQTFCLLSHFELGSTMKGWFMVFKQFSGFFKNRKSPSLVVNEKLPNRARDFNFFIRRRKKAMTTICSLVFSKVRVIDSIHISIQQPIVHSAILRRFDNLCCQTMSRQDAEWESDERFIGCLFFESPGHHFWVLRNKKGELSTLISGQHGFEFHWWRKMFHRMRSKGDAKQRDLRARERETMV